MHTGTAENTGHLDQLGGSLGSVHFDREEIRESWIC